MSCMIAPCIVWKQINLIYIRASQFQTTGPECSVYVVLKLPCVTSDLEHLSECRCRRCALWRWAGEATLLTNCFKAFQWEMLIWCLGLSELPGNGEERDWILVSQGRTKAIEVFIHLPQKLPWWRFLENGYNLFVLSSLKQKGDQNAKDLCSTGLKEALHMVYC